MPMDWNRDHIDLTISFDGPDADRLLADWRWLVPQNFQPLHLTKFGHWFLSSPDGRIHHLNLIEGNLLQVAKSRQQFDAMKDDEQIRNEWFQAAFVFQCKAEGLSLKPGECFGWRVHPMVGGRLELANIQAFPLAAYQSLIAQLLQPRLNLTPGDSIPSM